MIVTEHRTTLHTTIFLYIWVSLFLALGFFIPEWIAVFVFVALLFYHKCWKIQPVYQSLFKFILATYSMTILVMATSTHHFVTVNPFTLFMAIIMPFAVILLLTIRNPGTSLLNHP